MRTFYSIKKMFSVALATVFAVSCIAATGCGEANNTVSKETEAEQIKKPETIEVFMYADMLYGAKITEESEEYLEKLLSDDGAEGDIDIDFIISEGTSYTLPYVGNYGTLPDVILLPYEEYVLCATAGVFWNMTDAWEPWRRENSDRIASGFEDDIKDYYVQGIKGGEGIFGIPSYRGNACCTYVKSDWLERAGVNRDSIEGKAIPFSEYYEILKKLKNVSKSGYVISPPGFVADEEPYTQYLPEFYQDAHFSFYKNELGEYVDGFSEQAMMDALTRIQTAVKDGIINKNADDVTKEDCCEFFCTPDTMKETGVITYWAGRWADTFSTSLNGKKRTDGTTMSGDLVVMNPIIELGAYVKSKPPVWCIKSGCENPEGVFKYFLEPMLDGGDVQTVWQYGVKGTHWDDNTKDFAINHIDPLFAITPLNDDPGLAKVSTLAKDSVEFMEKNSKRGECLPVTDYSGTNMWDINNKRKEIVWKVALDSSYSAEQGIKDYQAAVGHMVEQVLESFNGLK